MKERRKIYVLTNIWIYLFYHSLNIRSFQLFFNLQYPVGKKATVFKFKVLDISTTIFHFSLLSFAHYLSLTFPYIQKLQFSCEEHANFCDF